MVPSHTKNAVKVTLKQHMTKTPSTIKNVAQIISHVLKKEKTRNREESVRDEFWVVEGGPISWDTQTGCLVFS